MITYGLQWNDASKIYDPHKALYKRFVRWRLLGVFGRVVVALATEGGKTRRIMSNATHLKGHRTAAAPHGGSGKRPQGAREMLERLPKAGAHRRSRL